MDPSAAPATPTDGDLARAVARGDGTAEAALYERFAGRVYYLARRELRSGDLADEARSETFLRVLQALRQGRLRSADSLAGFVLHTARNVVHEMIRVRARAHAFATDVDTVPDTAALAPIPSELVDTVRAILRDLSPRDRAFLRMYYYDDLSKAEIAKRLGMAPERLRLIKSRALARFRRALEKGNHR